ncbi:hypothetical protein [Sphingomonas sp. M1-B02]|uniref:hypothetical protein n=1 Tax=Sphingomonas sp. M1-B02 TaxID=3114300 RepID=UPI0022402527|nr:hypothetical protein [Sphingomonas sp. S6-11]UZK64802.1 hypothetical protein OKW87_09670 [Sphingomonas sp. S6-11]
MAKPFSAIDVSVSMKHLSASSTAILAVTLAAAACSSGPDEPSAAAPTPGATDVLRTAPAPAAPPNPLSNRAADAPGPVSPAATPAKLLALEGLGNLRIGQPVPENGPWRERGAQTSDACRTVSSPEYPGVYAIVSEGKVQRITVGKRSDVKLAEGVGAGASEKDVKKWFAGFREEPHKYEDAPAKYLTAPNAAAGGPALRFEIGRDGEVSLIHVGTMPVLAYVEGCA